MISVESIELLPEDAFRIALERRLDFMNGRASLVDSWRMLQVNADALQSVLDVTVSGDIGTARDNPVSFRSPTASLRMGLEFDAPLTRLLERNDYREALITYQRNRRELIQSHDLLEKGLLAISGRDENLGRALLYITTSTFLELFALELILTKPL